MTSYERNLTLISNILNEFDFDRVHRVMKHLDWGWFGEGVPSIESIRFSARERIDSAINGCLKEGTTGESYFSSSGGLKATVIKNEYGQIDFIELEFILTSWDVSPDNYDIEV